MHLGAKDNFAILPSIDFGIGYDYGSVMHYSAYAFAKDEKVPTIITIVSNHYFRKRTSLVYQLLALLD